MDPQVAPFASVAYLGGTSFETAHQEARGLSKLNSMSVPPAVPTFRMSCRELKIPALILVSNRGTNQC
jgi:hypothetical protein